MEPRRRDTRPLAPQQSARAARDRRGEGASTGRAVVIEPILRRAAFNPGKRDPAAKLDEAIGLACAIDLDVEQSGIVMLNALRPATFLGKGKVEEISGLVKSFDAGIVDGLRIVAGAAA